MELKDNPRVKQLIINRRWDDLDVSAADLPETVHLKATQMAVSPDGKLLVIRDTANGIHRLVDSHTQQRKFTLRHWLMCDGDIKWLPGFNSIVYEYDAGRDDPPKIFASNIKTGQTILLGGKLFGGLFPPE